VHHAQILLKEDDLRCGLGDIGRAIDRDTDIRRVKGGGIVDPVAEEANRLPQLLQGHDHAQLLLRRDTAEQSRCSQTADQGLVAQRR
jgi:hypothetical protein